VRPELAADRFHPHVPRVAIVGRGAHLDQLVRLQRALDLGEHLVGEALVADEHDGIQAMRLRAQLAAPGGGEGRGHRAIIPELSRSNASAFPLPGGRKALRELFAT
jgi:hypothetical protein